MPAWCQLLGSKNVEDSVCRHATHKMAQRTLARLQIPSLGLSFLICQMRGRRYQPLPVVVQGIFPRGPEEGAYDKDTNSSGFSGHRRQGHPTRRGSALLTPTAVSQYS